MCSPAGRLSTAAPRVPRPRIQGLSDLIFGLALSIGAVEFIGNTPPNPQQLTADLAYFGFSFVILIGVWNRYTTMMSAMPVETPLLFRANVLLLFLVAIEPFLFGVMFVAGFREDVGAAASVYYGLDLGGMNLILAYFSHTLASEEKNLIPRELIHRYKFIRNMLILVGVVFLFSDLPVFGNVMLGETPVRVVIWLVTLPMIWLRGLARWGPREGPPLEPPKVD